MTADPSFPNTEPQPGLNHLWLLVGGLACFLALCLCLVIGFFGYRALKENQFIRTEPTRAKPTQAEPTPQGPTGEDVPLQPANHVQMGVPHTPYNSDPPTSGAHYPVPASAGFYTTAPPDEQLVHNLEHGYVIIWYNCDGLTADKCQQLQDKIQTAMDKAGNSPNTGTPKLIAVPRPGMDAQLALTTWGRLDKFDAFDEQRILNFIRDFRDQAPEPNIP